MSFFEKNINAVKTRDPETARWIESARIPEWLTVSEAKSGAPVPRLGDIILHSGYYPEKESEKFAAGIETGPGDTVVVFGFGFGYHLETLYLTGAEVVVIEPSAMMIKAAFESRDLAALLEKIDIHSPERFDSIAEKLDYKKTIWIDHEPSVRLNPKENESLAETFTARAIAARRKYKILVAGPIYGGTTTTARSCVNALKALRFNVEFVDNTVYRENFFRINDITPNQTHVNALKKIYSNFLGEAVAARADYFQPDIILSIAQAPLAPENINRLKDLGVPVVFWFVEDYRTLSYWKIVAPHYDYFFCIQKGNFLNKLDRAGAPYAGYLPQAADPQVHRPYSLTDEEKAKYEAVISFMGAGYPNRRQFFPGLLDTPLKIWGTEWDLSTPIGQRVVNGNVRLEPEEYVKIFNASQINLNLHSSVTHPGVDPIGDFANPRTFEIAACGGFQIVDTRDDMPEMFEIGREIVTFSNIDDLREKIDYYLNHPGERKEIAEAGKRRVLSEHTFVHRMARMINIVAERDDRKIETARGRRRSVNDVDEIIRRADKPELVEFLGQFKGEGRLSLPKVMEAIAKGEGDITRPEAIFMIIDQILSPNPGGGS